MRVLAIDSLDYGRAENLDLSDPDVQLEQLRLPCRAGERLRHLLEGVDYVFHLAAEKHNQSINSPCRVLDANVMGTYELLSAAAGAGVKKIVFTSSLYVYGRMSAPPMSEDEVTAPQTVYGISSLAGRSYAATSTCSVECQPCVCDSSSSMARASIQGWDTSRSLLRISIACSRGINR